MPTIQLRPRSRRSRPGDSLHDGLLVLAAGLAVGGVATFRLALPKPGEIDVTPADAMPLPVVPEGPVGRVLVTARYDIAPGSEDAFLARTDQLRHFRQRTGAVEWRLFLDASTPGRYLETFLVGSWEEHERQHARATKHDQQLLVEIDKLLLPGTSREAHHYLTPTLTGGAQLDGKPDNDEPIYASNSVHESRENGGACGTQYPRLVLLRSLHATPSGAHERPALRAGSATRGFARGRRSLPVHPRR